MDDDNAKSLRPDIAAAKARMSGTLLSTSVGGVLALRRLEEQVSPEEEVLCLANGYLRGRGALAVLTSKRVLILRARLIRKDNIDIALSQVSAVTHTRGFVYSKVTVHSSGGHEVIERLQRGDAEAFVELARERIGAGSSYVARFSTTAEGTSGAAPANADVIGQLRQLGELREVGVLTEEEFQAKKQALLKRL